MDQSNFHMSLNHVAHQGVVVSTEHSVALQSSLLLLQNSQKFGSVRFWGKITGSGAADYYIAQGFNDSVMTPVSTYYSQDCINWAMVPTLHPVFAETCLRIRTRFTGNPSKETQVTEPGPGPNEAQPDLPAEVAELRQTESKEDGTVVISTTVTEDKRLAAVVAKIDEEVAIVPRKSLRTTASDEVFVNSSFSGLSSVDAMRKESYFHRRPAEKLSAKSAIERAKMDRSFDFLDSIAEDVPAQSWSLRSEQGGRVVVVSSLLWPGSMHYTLPGTPQHGQIYWGTGVKNFDLPFMV